MCLIIVHYSTILFVILISKLTLPVSNYPIFFRKFLKNLCVRAINPPIDLSIASDRESSVFIFVSSTISAPIRARWRANGFPESICHGFFHRPGWWSRTCTLPQYVSCCRFMHSCCHGVRTNVKNDSVSDIPGIGSRARFSTKYLLRPPRHYLYLMTRNYILCIIKMFDGKIKLRWMFLSNSFKFQLTNINWTLIFSCLTNRWCE